LSRQRYSQQAHILFIEMKLKTSRRKKEQTTTAMAGQELILSVRQAIGWSDGKKVPVSVTTVRVPSVDVREIRRRLRLSQGQFANSFGFSAAAVRNWEQGRTRPDGPSLILLAVISKHPEAVQDALSVSLPE